MEVAELQAKIISNKVPSFLIFTGDDWEVQKIYIENMKKGKNYQRIDAVQDILSKLSSKSFISKGSTLYIVRDDMDFVTNDKNWAKLERVIGHNMLIFLATKPDKRLKFFNKYKSVCVDFKALPAANLKKYLLKEIQLSDKNCERLMEICEYNYGRCLLEIDKIKHWIKGYGRDKQQLMPEDNAFLRLVGDGTIYQPPKDAIFDLVDAILDRREDKVYSLYEQCKAIKEQNLAILVNLFNNAKAVLQVQTCHSKDVAKTTGLTGWQIMNAKKHLNNYSPEELEYLLQLIYKCQKGVMTGEIDSQFVVDYILVKVL